MKAFIALIAATSLPLAVHAQKTRSAAPVADAVSSSISTCSVSRSDNVSAVEFSLRPSSSIVDQTLHLTTTPSSTGGPPTITAQAIITKGARGDLVISSVAGHTPPPGSSTYAKISRDEGGIPSGGYASVTCSDVTAPKQTQGVTFDERSSLASCVIRSERVSVTLRDKPPFAGDKVTVQDLHFSYVDGASRSEVGSASGGSTVMCDSNINGINGDLPNRISMNVTLAQ